MKMNEIKSKYNSKKLLEEARGESFQQSLDEFLGGKRAKEKNRRRTTDGIPPPGLRRRRLSEESSGRSSEDRRKALTRTLSAQSLGYQDDKLNSSFQSQSNSRRRRGSAANDLLADSDHCIEKKKFSDMKVSQRPRNRRRSM